MSSGVPSVVRAPASRVRTAARYIVSGVELATLFSVDIPLGIAGSVGVSIAVGFVVLAGTQGWLSPETVVAWWHTEWFRFWLVFAALRAVVFPLVRFTVTPWLLSFARFQPDHWSPPLPVTGRTLVDACMTIWQLAASLLCLERVWDPVHPAIVLVAAGVLWTCLTTLLDVAREPPGQLMTYTHAAQPEATWFTYLTPIQYSVLRLGWHDERTLHRATQALPPLVIPTLREHATRWFVCRACSSLLAHADDMLPNPTNLFVYFGPIDHVLASKHIALVRHRYISDDKRRQYRAQRILCRELVSVVCMCCGSIVGEMTFLGEPSIAGGSLILYRVALIGGGDDERR